MASKAPSMISRIDWPGAAFIAVFEYLVLFLLGTFVMYGGNFHLSSASPKFWFTTLGLTVIMTIPYFVSQIRFIKKQDAARH